MGSLSESLWNKIDIAAIVLIEQLSDVLYPPFKLIFMNCPLFYQIIYGYGLVFIIYRTRKARKNDNFFDNDSVTWFVSIILSIVSNLKNPLLILDSLIRIKTQAVYLYKNYLYRLKNIEIKEAFKAIKKINKSNFWKPVFKKFSYLGIFSFLRSKWYKKKK